MMELEKTVELDRGEVMAALERSKHAPDISAEAAGNKHSMEELRRAIGVIRRWAENHDQWLVILAPWGMHHYGKLTEEQVELIVKRFSSRE
jgi:aspartate/tyrosine/aromatic aminotransferase